MAYEKQTWNTGDIVTAEKLNHIEAGIEEAYLEPEPPEPPTPTPPSVQFIDADISQGGSLGDYSWNSIRALIADGILPVLRFSVGSAINLLTYKYSEEQSGTYMVCFGSSGDDIQCYSDSADGQLYPD